MFTFFINTQNLSIFLLIIQFVSASLTGERHSYVTVKLAVGEAIKFYCPHQRFADYPLKWTKQNIPEPIGIALNGTNSWIHKDYRNRTEINIHNQPYSKSFILLKNVTKSDQGMYSCHERMSKHLKANTEVRTENKWIEVLSNNYIHTYVIVLPKLTFKIKPPQVIYSPLTEKVIINCEVDGIDVEWFQNNALISLEAQKLNTSNKYQVTGKTLIINPDYNDIYSTRNRSERYLCCARNEIETIQTSILIKYVEKSERLDPVVILTVPMNQTVVEGYQTRFDCDVFGSSHYIQKTWMFNGVNINKSEAHQNGLYTLTDHELIINKVMVGHIGHYTCFAKDHRGNTASATAYLNVEYPAQVTNYKKTVHLILGQSGLITCDTIANPPLLDTKWSFGNLSFEDLRDTHIKKRGTDSLFFNKVSRKHSGSYYCLPINSRTDLVFPVDNVAQEIELIVDDPIYFTSTLPMIIKVNFGETVNLICSGNGHPTTKMIWKKLNYSKWVQVTKSQIKLNSDEDEGLYKCILYNDHQSIEHITRVIIKH